jgi:hypothetical protein
MVLRADAGASPELVAAARATGGSVTVMLPLKIHGYSLGMPNPGLMPTTRERAGADVDVDGQIVVTRHAHRAITRIVRRRGATRVLLEDSTAGRLRRFLEGDLRTQLSRRLGPSVTVASATEADRSAA